ncbi:MAG: lysozyme [Allosphingosinicella sp.]
MVAARQHSGDALDQGQIRDGHERNLLRVEGTTEKRAAGCGTVEIDSKGRRSRLPPSGDPWTIGWGSAGPDIGKGPVWTQQQCDDRFTSHLAEFAANVGKVLGSTPTTQSRFDAMVSFAYNVGVANLAASTLLKKHKAGDYKGAAAEFARWNKAAGKVLPGLTRRRAAEAALYAD